MQNMPNMLAYTIQSGMSSGSSPFIVVGQGGDKVHLKPQNPQDDSYWIVILDASNPKHRVKEFIVPGSNVTTVPAGLDDYMKNPAYIFAVVTQFLNTLHVPQGAFYQYLLKYGADRELQRLEQINTTLSCGTYGRMSYILTGPCGPRDPGRKRDLTKERPPYRGYEFGSYRHSALALLSLMPHGNPPHYTICDHNTFVGG